jgi:hypothetical protein
VVPRALGSVPRQDLIDALDRERHRPVPAKAASSMRRSCAKHAPARSQVSTQSKAA